MNNGRLPTQVGHRGEASAKEMLEILQGVNKQLGQLGLKIAVLEAKPDPVITPGSIGLGALSPAVMSAVGGVVNAGNIQTLGAANANTASGLSLKEDRANKDRPNGYPSLDGDSTVPVAEIPDLSSLYAEALVWDYLFSLKREVNFLKMLFGIETQEAAYENGI